MHGSTAVHTALATTDLHKSWPQQTIRYRVPRRGPHWTHRAETRANGAASAHGSGQHMRRSTHAYKDMHIHPGTQAPAHKLPLRRPPSHRQDSCQSESQAEQTKSASWTDVAWQVPCTRDRRLPQMRTRPQLQNATQAPSCTQRYPALHTTFHSHALQQQH